MVINDFVSGTMDIVNHPWLTTKTVILNRFVLSIANVRGI